MELTENQLREITALAGAVLGQDDLVGTLQEITRIAARIVPGTDAVSITTFQDGRPTAVAFSDEWAKELDELQFDEREGPCLDATRTGNLFRMQDLEADTRWPAYTERATRHGARSAVSIPLHSEVGNFGAMNLYSRTPDAFTGEAVALAQVLAGQAGHASLVAAAFFRHRDLAEQLREAIRSRSVIDQAMGVLMAQRKITADAAFGLLRDASQHRNVKLRLVAQEVVDTGTLPGRG
ncbi:GAF and ANTAR domain-containing protein [Cryptosporangium minutisporangium]|uniref:GAF and ANTAR domain-containing protein n=1 Tax=Cryptosporangium minutisporangium TaxID=113569 RepID=A0ABP6T9K8_9ACTN